MYESNNQSSKDVTVQRRADVPGDSLNLRAEDRATASLRLRMTICSDNSTECLLRALVDAGNSFDWNPLNFAFTAATGILALLIAYIAIFQGLLAAGPGRLKASRSAIGPWSAKSKSRFDQVELSLRTTAEVPFIDFARMPDDIHGPRFPTYPVPYRSAAIEQEPSSTATANAAAGWLALLRNAGFASPDYWKTRPVSTDYLPADVQAAPASASVLCLVGLALVSDRGVTIDRKLGSRFVRVQGSISQLSMREHPILGPVCVYEIYGDPLPPMLAESAQACLAFALGEMTCGAVHLDMEPIRQSSMSLPDRFWKYILCSKVSREHPEHFNEGALERWLGDLSPLSGKSLVVSLLLLCDVPGEAEARAFPYEHLRPAVIRAIKILSQKAVIWSHDVFAPMIAKDPRSLLNNLGHRSRFNYTSWLLRPKSDVPTHDHWLNPDTFEMCMRWTRLLQKDETGSLGTTSDQQKAFEKSALHMQLAIPDRIIRDHYLKTAVSTVGILLIEIDNEGRGLQSQPSLIQPGDAETVAALLTLRIVSYAAMLSLCTDTGFIYNGDFKDSIVKIL